MNRVPACEAKGLSRRELLQGACAAGVGASLVAAASASAQEGTGLTMDTAERLAAIEEIKQLRAKYWRCIDAKQFDDIADLFTEDAWFDSSEAQFDPVLGQQPGSEPAELWSTRQVIVDKIRAGMPEGLQSAHMGHTPEVEILTDTTASAIHPFNDRLTMPGILSFNGYGYYYDTYEKGTDGKWRVKTCTIKRLRVVFDE